MLYNIVKLCFASVQTTDEFLDYFDIGDLLSAAVKTEFGGVFQLSMHIQSKLACGNFGL